MLLTFSLRRFRTSRSIAPASWGCTLTELWTDGTSLRVMVIPPILCSRARSRQCRAARLEELTQQRPMTARFVGAVTSDGEICTVRQRRQRIEEMTRLRPLHFTAKLPRKRVPRRGELLDRAAFTNSELGARFGSQTSYQSSAAYRLLGTPRGGRRTVPRRTPSSLRRGLPS